MPFAEGTPTVEITLGGKTYTLGWTWGARRRQREHFTGLGKDLEKVSQQEAVAAALWAGMEEQARAELSVDAVEEMIHPGNEMEILDKMGSLFERSQPDPDPKQKPVAAKEPTTGQSSSTRSGQLASTT